MLRWLLFKKWQKNYKIAVGCVKRWVCSNCSGTNDKERIDYCICGMEQPGITVKLSDDFIIAKSFLDFKTFKESVKPFLNLF